MEDKPAIHGGEDVKSNFEAILEHIQKPKKLVLPKGYLRKQTNHMDLIDIEDNLTMDNITEISNKREEEDAKIIKNSIYEVVDKVIDKPDNKTVNEQEDVKVKKTRKPTAYNIFVKETVIRLQETHKELTPKERFKLAIKMWGENKSK